MVKKLTKKRQNQFRKDLKYASAEKDVEHAYKSIVNDAHGSNGIWQSKYKTDGYYTHGIFLRLLLETKFDENFMQKKAKCETLAQALYYLKGFEANGDDIPNVIMVGDMNECFVVAGSILYKYLKEDLDWSIAPSDAARRNPSLIVKMIDDQGICPFVFDVTSSKNDFNEVIRIIDEISENGEVEKIPVTEHNIRVAYDEFLRHVFPRKTKLSSDQLVSIFIQSMICPDDCYLHPKKPNVLVMRDKTEVPINSLDYYAFFSRFDRSYSAEERRVVTEIADRLIEETNRRFSGDFWTPSRWVDEAHSMLDENLGDTWRDDFTVWDCACGTKNLTRDYRFGNLFLSTLYQSELDMSVDYNASASCFQFDFLNDDMNLGPGVSAGDLDKIPGRLLSDLEDDMPLLVLINPPYGTANDMHSDSRHKSGIADTAIRALMVEEGLGQASRQLFAQFLWRIAKIKRDFHLSRVVIGVYMVPSVFNPTDHWSKFSEGFLADFPFRAGMLFNAGEFSNVKDKWGVTFSIFDSAADEGAEIALSVKETDNMGRVATIGVKRPRKIPADKSLNSWAKEPLSGKPLLRDPKPLLASGLTISRSHELKSVVEGSFGYMVSNSNDVSNSDKCTWICSGPIGKGHGFSVCRENFERSLVTFACRKLCVWNWMNDKDQFQAPDTECGDYAQFSMDCCVYAIFHKDCHAASADAFEYEGELYTLRNEWFPFSRDGMMNLANNKAHPDAAMYNAAKTDSEREMCKLIAEARKNGTLSNEAESVLERAWQIVKDSFPVRVACQYGSPELFLGQWDAGWYQIKRCLGEDGYKTISVDLRKAHRALGDKIRPQIYTRGILPNDDFGAGSSA